MTIQPWGYFDSHIIADTLQMATNKTTAATELFPRWETGYLVLGRVDQNH
jgi:hypothetical protein